MKISDLTFNYYNRKNNKSVYLILHGSGLNGINDSFIKNIFLSLQDDISRSVFMFNFLYCERGKKGSSGKELIEEKETLETVIDFLEKEGYRCYNRVIEFCTKRERHYISLEIIISSTHKEIAISRTKNRLTVQIS